MDSADVRIPGTTSQTVLGAWGLFTAVALVMVGNGLLVTLLGVRAEIEGFSTTTTGIVFAGYFIGFLGGAWIVPRFVVSVGHIRSYAALASIASAAALLHIVTASPGAWLFARLVTGFAMSGLFIIAESWLNDAATNETRGRLLSIYMVVMTGAFALGQLLLASGDPAGVVLFIVASVLVSIAVVPITLSASPTPDFTLSTSLPIRDVWRVAPLGLIGGFGNGLGVGAFFSLGAVYATRVGMSVNRIALFMGIAVLGSVILQAPIGIISDRIQRRQAILGLALLASGASLVMLFTDPLGLTAFGVVGLVGGLSFPMYSLALSHINDHVPYGTAVAVSSLYVFVTGVGAIIGPILGAVMIDSLGPDGLFWLMAWTNAAIAAFALLRISTRPGLPVKEQRAFAMVPARAGAVILSVARRAKRPRGKHRPSNGKNGLPGA